MVEDLSGKVALVVGASSGIGESTALRLAEAGAIVAVCGRRTERLEALVNRIEARGGRAQATVADVAIEAEATAAVEQVVARFGRLDILINSAGVAEGGGVGSLTLDLWRRVLDTNLMGTLYACKAALPAMKEQGAGDIVNVSSTAGRQGSAAYASYATSKHGLTGLTESLRQEVGALGIRVSIVEPGATRTEVHNSLSDAAYREAMREWVYKEGTMEAADIADGIMLALSLPRRANAAVIHIRPTNDIRPM